MKDNDIEKTLKGEQYYCSTDSFVYTHICTVRNHSGLRFLPRQVVTGQYNSGRPVEPVTSTNMTAVHEKPATERP